MKRKKETKRENGNDREQKRKKKEKEKVTEIHRKIKHNRKRIVSHRESRVENHVS